MTVMCNALTSVMQSMLYKNYQKMISIIRIAINRLFLKSPSIFIKIQGNGSRECT